MSKSNYIIHVGGTVPLCMASGYMEGHTRTHTYTITRARARKNTHTHTHTHRLPYEAFFHYIDKMLLIEQMYAAKH